MSGPCFTQEGHEQCFLGSARDIISVWRVCEQSHCGKAAEHACGCYKAVAGFLLSCVQAFRSMSWLTASAAYPFLADAQYCLHYVRGLGKCRPAYEGSHRGRPPRACNSMALPSFLCFPRKHSCRSKEDWNIDRRVRWRFEQTFWRAEAAVVPPWLWWGHWRSSYCLFRVSRIWLLRFLRGSLSTTLGRPKPASSCGRRCGLGMSGALCRACAAQTHLLCRVQNASSSHVDCFILCRYILKRLSSVIFGFAV